jgi:hypothetical protein
MKEEEARKPLRPVQANVPQLVLVEDKAKFEEELRMLSAEGVGMFRPDAMKPGLDRGSDSGAVRYQVQILTCTC